MSETAANFSNGSSKRPAMATTAASLLLSGQTPGGPILTNSILTNLNKPPLIQNGASSNPFRNKTPQSNEEPDEKPRDYLDEQLVDSPKQNGKSNFLSLNANVKVIDGDGAEMQQTVKSSKINRTNENGKKVAATDQTTSNHQTGSKNHHNHHHHNNKNHHHHNNHNSNNLSTSETILLKELMQLSIKREKIEKSLAATGYQKSIDAINWLMKHSRDPILVDDSILSTRDYILVLCPVGRLANQIATFLNQSKSKCGPNEAHYSNVLPYMKLSSFFKVNRISSIFFIFARMNFLNFIYLFFFYNKKLKDSQVCNLHKSFDLVFSRADSNQLADQLQNKKSRLNEINIDLHITSQMILLYPDIDSENLIKDIVESFSRVASKLSNIHFFSHSYFFIINI